MTEAATAALVAGLLAGYGIAMPVGAMSVLIVTLSSRVSFRHGLAAALGVALADGLFALAAVLGGAALARVISPLTSVLQSAAAAVLVVLAVRGTVTALREHRRIRVGGGGGAVATERDVPVPADGVRPPLRTFAGMVGLTLLNPVTLVYFGVLVVGRRPGDDSLGPGLLFVLAAFVASASWQTLLASAGALLGRALTGPSGRLLTALVGNGVILLLALWLAWKAVTGT
ncbi:LysE family transporter [Streptomyces sp. NPDC048442]|uniref:LysE family transporter n=1 Tax=Streptomyces sp. NPDC048442 TaxID=3154823 RepID=UPI003445770D